MILTFCTSNNFNKKQEMETHHRHKMRALTGIKHQETSTSNITPFNHLCRQVKMAFSSRMRGRNKLAVAAKNVWKCTSRDNIILNNIGSNSKNNINKLPIRFYNKTIKIRRITTMAYHSRSEWVWLLEMVQLLLSTLKNMETGAARYIHRTYRKHRVYRRWLSRYIASRGRDSQQSWTTLRTSIKALRWVCKFHSTSNSNYQVRRIHNRAICRTVQVDK